MRAHAPGRPKLWPGGDENEQGRQRTAFGNAAQQDRAWSDRPNADLRAPAPPAESARRPSPNWSAPPVAGAAIPRAPKSGSAVLRQRNVQERREQGGILRRVELDQRQRILQVRETLLGGYVGAAETLAAPIGDRMQRRVLQKLRTTPFDPGVRRVAQPSMKFLDQAGFTQIPARPRSAPIARRPAAPAPSAASAWRFPRRDRRAA